MPEDIKQQYKSVYQDGFFFSIFGVKVKELCFFGKSCQKAPVFFKHAVKRGGHSFTFVVNLSEPGMWCQRWWPYWPTGAPLDDAGGEQFHQQKSRKTNQATKFYHFVSQKYLFFVFGWMVRSLLSTLSLVNEKFRSCQRCLTSSLLSRPSAVQRWKKTWLSRRF